MNILNFLLDSKSDQGVIYIKVKMGYNKVIYGKFNLLLNLNLDLKVIYLN